ncbi:MAG TPA: PEP-CTERM sorting domain-containing protein [Terriglobales bacterium]|nr:PEP-CTERM sorting domain-containing protein [Terriglobales bacterium]
MPQRLSRFFIVLISALLLSGLAFADSTVNMTFIGPGGNNGGGVYTYPYNFSINGGPSTPLICDTFDNEVVSGETWTATVSNLLSGTGLFGSNPSDYKAAGLIFEGITGGTINATVGNWAIWGLFSQNAINNPFYLSSGAGTLASQYLIAAASAPDSAFSGLVLYTPVAGTQSWGGLPQEYIGYGHVSAPEPASLAMLGMVLLTLGAATRKRFGVQAAKN